MLDAVARTWRALARRGGSSVTSKNPAQPMTPTTRASETACRDDPCTRPRHMRARSRFSTNSGLSRHSLSRTRLTRLTLGNF
jgi:hypothetical protein